jgi:hypothetical protein
VCAREIEARQNQEYRHRLVALGLAGKDPDRYYAFVTEQVTLLAEVAYGIASVDERSDGSIWLRVFDHRAHYHTDVALAAKKALTDYLRPRVKQW